MSMSRLTERCSEIFQKKLIGRTDMEDALKRLDKLTQEEARVAVAQNLKATHTVDDRVANMVVAIDNSLAGVDDLVAAAVDDHVARNFDMVTSVDDRIASVDDKVDRVDSRAKVVDDKVADAIRGAQIISVKPEKSLI